MTGDWPAISSDVADVVDRLLDQRDVVAVRILDDVVDDEHLRVRQCRDHPADVLGRGGDDLHVQLCEFADFVDQEQVRRLGDGDRQHAANQEQRQHQVLFDVFPRQQFDDLQVAKPRFELGVGHAILAGQALDDLILGAVALVDENFAQQLIHAGGLLLLLRQCRLEVFLREETSFDEKIAEPDSGGGRRIHGGHAF